MILQSSTCRSTQAFQQPLPLKGRVDTTQCTHLHEKPVHSGFFRRRSQYEQRTALNSMQSLIEDLSSSTSSATRTIFVGGKGGVGKTTGTSM